MKKACAVRLVATCVGLFILLPDTGARIVRASAPGQAEALARLVSDILTCDTHPCGGDTHKHIQGLLENRMVSDGSFEYSDLAGTFPDVGGDLEGVVEWDFSGGEVDAISLIVVGFNDSRETLKSEMEAALPGCVFDPTPADDDDMPADDPAASPDVPTSLAGAEPEDWDCTADHPGHKEADITIHVAPETLMIEII